MPLRFPRLSNRASSLSSRDLLFLLAILAIAASFRIYSLDWDSGNHQHPDERFLTQVAAAVQAPESWGDYFSTQLSSLNPYARGFDRYAYGQLPLTVTRLVAEHLGRASYDTVYMVGRALSVAADLGTIIFAWLLARRVFGRWHAHLAALLLALTVLHIQLAHFLAVDTFVAFFSAACLFWGQRAWQRDSLADAAVAGVMAGFATACKISAVALLPVLLVALLWPRSAKPWREHLLDGLTAFGMALLGSFAAFRVAEPYAFLGSAPWNLRPNPQWFADKAYWAGVSSGAVDVPYMIQWAGTAPYSFVLRAIVEWGMGPALGVAALGGLALAGWRLVRGETQAREALLVVAWVVLNLVYFGGQFAKFMRYLLPAYFALAILAAYGLLFLLERAGIETGRRGDTGTRGRGDAGTRGVGGRSFPPLKSRARALGKFMALALPAVVIALTAGWALAFVHVYAQPHSRIQASGWIYGNIPSGKTLATEHWDDRLPLALSGLDGRQYRYAELALYDPETPSKRERLAAALDQADYVILASRRLVDSIPRLPERYPLATTYYRLLFSGELGFERVARFQSAPSLGPITVDDSRAQEDFTVYDHPTVEVWAKRSDYSTLGVRQLLGAVPVERAINVRAIDGGKGALLLTPEERHAAEKAGTWSALFDRDGIANKIPIAVWLVVAELIALSAAPLLWWSLRFLPDRGFGASKIVGLALISYLAWLPASLKLMPFSRASLLLAWGMLVAVSGLLAWRWRVELLAWVRRQRWLLLAVEGAFLAGTALFLWIRAANPDLWHPVFGGEKPMNFAYLNAVVKSEYFPPYDPWFAGGYINYYYFGFVLVAALIKLTGIVPAVAFNLAQPTLFGAVCASAFSLAFNLSVPARGAMRRGGAYVAGTAAVLLVGVLGNLDAGLQVLEQLWRLGGQLAPESGGIPRLVMGLVAIWQGQRFPPLDFWRSTRFIGPEDPGPIHEFPYFTFLYGDLHAHQLALPLTLAALVVALNLTRQARWNPRLVAWPSLALAALIVGMLRASNTWDFPTYAGITVLALGIGYLPALRRAGERESGRPGDTPHPDPLPSRGEGEDARDVRGEGDAPRDLRAEGEDAHAGRGGVQTALKRLGFRSLPSGGGRRAVARALLVSAVFVFVASQLLFWPYLQRYQLFYGGVDPVKAKTALNQYLMIHGLFLFLGGSLVAWYAARAWRRTAVERRQRALVAEPGYFGMLVPVFEAGVRETGQRGARDRASVWREAATSPAIWLALVGVLLAAGLLMAGFPIRAFIVLGIAAFAGVGLAQWRHAGRVFHAILFVVALLVTLVPEFVALQGDIGRMNTVFKFYMQAWVLMAVGSAVAVGWLARRVNRDRFLRKGRVAWLGATALLLFAAASYPLFATEAKVGLRFAHLPLTLDGAAYMDHARYSDRERDLNLPADARAIRWLQDTVIGSPVILEGRAPLYRWGSRVSIYTGLPTVLGWDWHQQQQRWGYAPMIQERIVDVQRAFDSPSPGDALSVIRKYDVRWVYVGGLERAYYSAAGLEKFIGMSELRLAYDRDGVQIYEVLS